MVQNVKQQRDKELGSDPVKRQSPMPLYGTAQSILLRSSFRLRKSITTAGQVGGEVERGGQSDSQYSVKHATL